MTRARTTWARTTWARTTRARTIVLCASLIAVIATRAPAMAHAADAPLPASSASSGSAKAGPSAIDPTMFALEGDGDGGPARAPRTAPPVPVAQAPSWRQTGSWGWLVVVTSVGLGVATTAYGLTLRCADDATQCRRNTALAIWGGVGIAAVGSTFGILIVQWGHARVNAKPAVFAGDSRSYGEASSPPLLPGLMLDAQF